MSDLKHKVWGNEMHVESGDRHRVRVDDRSRGDQYADPADGRFLATVAAQRVEMRVRLAGFEVTGCV